MKTLAPGETVDSLTVVSLIGKGGFGEVYLVRDVSGGRFALKVLQKCADTEISGFVRVRDALGKIDGLATIHSAGKLADGRLYYLMECADNLGNGDEYIPDTLANRMTRNGAINPLQLLDIVDEILAVCEKLHAAGYVHRDIKPENVIFVGGKTKLADFGLLAPVGDEKADAGTSGFMPHEEIFGKVQGGYHAGMDLYAAGKLLYCAFNLRAAEEYPAPGEKIDPAAYRIIRKIYTKALHETPAFRFRNAKQFRAAVRRARARLVTPRTSLGGTPLFLCVAILCLLGLFLCWRSCRFQPSPAPVASSSIPDTPWEEPLFTDEADRELFRQVTQTSAHGMNEYGMLCGKIYQLKSEIQSPLRRRDAETIRRELAAAQKEMENFSATDRGNIITAFADLTAAQIAGDPAGYRARREKLYQSIRNYRKTLHLQEHDGR